VKGESKWVTYVHPLFYSMPSIETQETDSLSFEPEGSLPSKSIWQETLIKLKEKIRPILDEIGAEEIDFTFSRANKALTLRLLADKEGGITLDECTLINKRIGRLIEEEDLISEKYILEVASPGLDRPLETKEDFNRIIGEKIEIWTSKDFSEKSYIDGSVKAASSDGAIVTVKSGKEITVPYDKINKARRKL